ncbi:hypothetical protein MAUB1S_06748 [Mycolicibacterium aubagnense]
MVVVTLAGSHELDALPRSLFAQECRDFELTVDQNPDDDLVPVLASVGG